MNVVTAPIPVVEDIGEEMVVALAGGVNVNVSPSVVSVVRDETVGSVTGGLVPIITTPELDINVVPSDNTVLIALVGVLVVLGLAVGGNSVKVSPSVTRVVADETVGSVTGGFVPIMTTPELDISVTPSGSVVVMALIGVLVVILELVIEGNSVKVSPSVIRVVAEETVGSVTGGFVPMITTPELDINVTPSGSVVVMTPIPDVVVIVALEPVVVGSRVKVSPSVTKVLSEVTLGSVKGGFVPMMITPPGLEMTVWPSGSVHVVAISGDVVVVGEAPPEGDSVKVSPSVVRVVNEETVGKVMGGLVPIITTPELEMTVCPSGSVQVVPAPTLEVPLGRGESVKVSPSVVKVLTREETVGRVMGGLVPIITTPELEMIVWPSGSVQVVAPALLVVVGNVGDVVGGGILLVDKPEGKLWVEFWIGPGACEKSVD